MGWSLIEALSGVPGSLGGSLIVWLVGPLGSLLGKSFGGSLGVSLAGPMGGAQGVLLSRSFREQFFGRRNLCTRRVLACIGRVGKSEAAAGLRVCWFLHSQTKRLVCSSRQKHGGI